MRVSDNIGNWIEVALFKHRQPDDQIWYDTTMAPTGGGPKGDAPFLACLLSMKSPVVNQTFNMTRFFPNFVYVTEEDIDQWVEDALVELRKAYEEALGAQHKNNRGEGPGRLFLPRSEA